MAKQNYKVLSPLQRDGKRYEPGATVAIDDEDVAAHLIGNGTIEAPEKAEKVEKK